MKNRVRGLLTQGNQKVGESIHVWSIPAITTCPGRSPTICEKVCYATKHRYQFPQVIERLEENWKLAQQDDFVDKMVTEIRRKGCLVVRVHGSGDFADVAYANKWLAIMRKCPKPRYYAYSRSWRSEEVRPVLEQMAALRCCRMWYSVDSETGLPDRVPRGVRLAYLMVDEEERVENVDLVFRVRKLRKQRLPLTLVCPSETQKGRDNHVNCGNCGRCYE